MTEDEMVGWHHQLNRHEFEQALGVGEGEGNLTCCSPCYLKESDKTLRPYGLQHRLPCSLPTPGACSNSCLLSW